MSKPIKQTVKFKSKPRAIYDLLVEAKKHSAFTEHKASNQKKAGGKFSFYDGYITGLNVELVPEKRIVQAWRGADFPKGTYSIAHFELKNARGGTELVFTQYGVPSKYHSRINQGWHEHYWNRMKKHLGE